MKRLKPISTMRPVRRRSDAADAGASDLLSLSEEGNLWAIAYADLLMVLMSFFVIFSSFGTGDAKNDLYKIALNISSTFANANSQTLLNGDKKSGVTATEDKKSAIFLPQSVFDQLASEHLKYIEDGKSVLVTFEGNQYASGKFLLSATLKLQLTQVAKTLEPYNERIQLLIVGHADSLKITNQKNRFLKDNFDLSSQRALEATRFLVDQGIPSNHLLSQAAADNETSTRSLSIRISAFKEREQ